MHCNRISSTIFRLYGKCPCIFLSLRFDDMRLCISYGIYIKDILKDYSNVVKKFYFALLFIYVYAMNDTDGLVQDLGEVKYLVPRTKNALTSRV